MSLVDYKKEETPLNKAIKIDTDGNNFLGTIAVGYKGATITPTVTAGSGTFVINKRRNDSARTSATMRAFESGAVATGEDRSVWAGTGVDIYLVVTSASSLVMNVDMDQWA